MSFMITLIELFEKIIEVKFVESNNNSQLLGILICYSKVEVKNKYINK